MKKCKKIEIDWCTGCWENVLEKWHFQIWTILYCFWTFSQPLLSFSCQESQDPSLEYPQSELWKNLKIHFFRNITNSNQFWQFFPSTNSHIHVFQIILPNFSDTPINTFCISSFFHNHDKHVQCKFSRSINQSETPRINVGLSLSRLYSSLSLISIYYRDPW